jgi:hypothetical protein
LSTAISAESAGGAFPSAAPSATTAAIIARTFMAPGTS